MKRIIKPYKRKKGSPKQKLELNSFNLFTDELVAIYNNKTQTLNKEIYLA